MDVRRYSAPEPPQRLRLLRWLSRSDSYEDCRHAAIGAGVFGFVFLATLAASGIALAIQSALPRPMGLTATLLFSAAVLAAAALAGFGALRLVDWLLRRLEGKGDENPKPLAPERLALFAYGLAISLAASALLVFLSTTAALVVGLAALVIGAVLSRRFGLRAVRNLVRKVALVDAKDLHSVKLVIIALSSPRPRNMDLPSAAGKTQRDSEHWADNATVNAIMCSLASTTWSDPPGAARLSGFIQELKSSTLSEGGDFAESPWCLALSTIAEHYWRDPYQRPKLAFIPSTQTEGFLPEPGEAPQVGHFTHILSKCYGAEAVRELVLPRLNSADFHSHESIALSLEAFRETDGFKAAGLYGLLDITGGTKFMSLALAMPAINDPNFRIGYARPNPSAGGGGETILQMYRVEGDMSAADSPVR